VPNNYRSSGLSLHLTTICDTHTRYDSSGQEIGSSQKSLNDNTQNSEEMYVHAKAEFKPEITASERPQTLPLDCEATEFDLYSTRTESS